MTTETDPSAEEQAPQEQEPVPQHPVTEEPYPGFVIGDEGRDRWEASAGLAAATWPDDHVQAWAMARALFHSDMPTYDPPGTEEGPGEDIEGDTETPEDAEKPAPEPNQEGLGEDIAPDISAEEALQEAEAHTGVMVALFPKPALARRLAVKGGEHPNELHVTLAFLGEKDDLKDPERLPEVVAGFAATCPPLTGEISGVGLFTAGPKPVTYASVDLPDLPEARQRLVDALKAAGFPPATDHGFTPHMTLAYDEIETRPKGKLRFEKVTVRIGDDSHDFDFTGAKVEEGAMDKYDAPTTAERAELIERHGAKGEGVSLKKDDKGYFVHTHRARSKSYPTVAAIPKSVVEFIESTG